MIALLASGGCTTGTPLTPATGNLHCSAGIIRWGQEIGVARRALGYDPLRIPDTHWSLDVEWLVVWRLLAGLRSS